jgi:hypothetical protein
MKNKVLLLATILTISCATNSFAAFSWLSTTAPVGGGTQNFPRTGTNLQLSVNPSANVVLGYDVTATGVSYTLCAYHVSGTFTYCTSSTDTNIYRFPTSGGNATQASVQKGPSAPATATTAIDWTSANGVAWTASK